MRHWRSSNPGIRCDRCVLGNFCRYEGRRHLCSYIGFPKYHHVCILIIGPFLIGQCSYSWYHSPIIKLSLFQIRIGFVIRRTLANRWSSFTISGLGSLVLCLWGEVYSGISLIITYRFPWQSTPPEESKLNTKLAQRLFLSALPFSELAWHRYLPPASSGLSGDWRQVLNEKWFSILPSKVTAQIGAAFMVASSSGADVFPLLVGQLVEDLPMGCVLLLS